VLLWAGDGMVRWSGELVKFAFAIRFSILSTLYMLVNTSMSLKPPSKEV
jgi:hypothetical protein